MYVMLEVSESNKTTLNINAWYLNRLRNLNLCGYLRDAKRSKELITLIFLNGKLINLIIWKKYKWYPGIKIVASVKYILLKYKIDIKRLNNYINMNKRIYTR